MHKSFLLSLLFVSTSLTLLSQKGPELGAWVGLSQYFGDLQTELTVADLHLGGGIVYRHNFDKRIAAKASLNYTRISGDDADSPNTFERQRNLSFHTDILDLTGQIEFNFLPYHHGSKHEYFTPYLLAGLSVFSYDPKATLDGQTYALRYFGTEGQALPALGREPVTVDPETPARPKQYGRFAFAPTIGLGIKWDINADWSINIESSVHLSGSDYLDDVSGTYPDLDILLAERGPTAVNLSNRATVPGLAEQGRQRGNNKNNDTYVLFGVSIMRYFGTLQCPDLSKR